MDILAESPDRFLLLPVRDERAWAFYQEAVACFWTAQELDLTHDRYSELQDSERTLLNNVLAFFAAADGIVGENLAANFIPQVQTAEMRAFYAFQAAIDAEGPAACPMRRAACASPLGYGPAAAVPCAHALARVDAFGAPRER